MVEWGSEGAWATAGVDWSDLAGLDQIARILSSGNDMAVVELQNGKEIRITAWLDLATGQYVSEYEQRAEVSNLGRIVHVWAKTPAYKPETAESAAACLEASVLQVDREHVFTY